MHGAFDPTACLNAATRKRDVIIDHQIDSDALPMERAAAHERLVNQLIDAVR